MPKSSADTQKLMRILSVTNDIDEFLDKHQNNMADSTFTMMINNLLEQKGLTVSKVVARSSMSQSYCYQLFKGSRQPSRDKIIQLGIGLKLTLKEINELLKAGGMAKLYCKHIRDAIIIYAVNNGLSVMQLEELLYEKELKTLIDC